MACAYELFGLFRLVAVGLASLTASFNHPVQQRDLRQAWQVLSPCAETASFDGVWALSLRENGEAILTSQREAQRLQGRWELIDHETRAYRIDVLAFATDVVVVRSPAGCLLASGALRSADLRQSWFSRGRSEGGDLVASASDTRATAQRQN
jgi:hypothetical protein